MTHRSKLSLLFLFLFAFRLYFGLSQPFFSPDELQTYLIGLKSYATGSWPYFGPDLIVTETGFYTQIPGALEGLLIALPLRLFPIPEAPFILLNLLSLSALALLAAAIARRLPEIPFPFILTWLALLPWNLHESANPINPSYLLFGSILFFTGFLEALPSLSLKRLSSPVAFGWMTFGLFWNMQFHFSWILLPPFLLAALVLRWREKYPRFAADILGLAAGAMIPLAFLLPTFLKYGFSPGTGGMKLSVAFNGDNLLAFPLILGRFFSLPSFEMTRFLLIPGAAHHSDFFRDSPALIPPAIFLMAVGWIQVPFLILGGWFKDRRHKSAQAIHLWTLLALLGVWVSFWFTSKEPLAHIYYILLPLIVIYSFYQWSRLAPYRWGKILGVACLAASFWFQGGYAARMIRTQSLYTNRALVIKAIREKNPSLLGERRPGAL